MMGRSESGSALTETLVGLLALLPAFWAVDYLGRLHDMDRYAAMTARYSAWQTLSGPAGERATHSPLWHFQGEDLVAPSHALEVQALTPNTAAAAISTGVAVETLAYGRYLPSAVNIGGLSSGMLELAPEQHPAYNAAISARPRLPGRSDKKPIPLRATATLSPGEWSAYTDKIYRTRTNQVVASEPVATLSQPASWLARFGIFEEGRYAQSTQFVAPSRITPR